MNFYLREQIDCPRTSCNGILIESSYQSRDLRHLRCAKCGAITTKKRELAFGIEK